MKEKLTKDIQILCIEDYAADRYLIERFFMAPPLKTNFSFATDGAEALDFLFRRGTKTIPVPDLILMDLNLPKVDGREVLKEVKASSGLSHIPVIILSTSENEKDIRTSYELHANCYLIKPQDLDDFQRLMESTASYWLKTVERVRVP